ncbi:MAG: Rrf2 family transcriptional regulator [Deferribacterales bacterium]|nr:Rrf2 family transcriptional regulator [Deferribacterales bacterium]
MKITRACDYTIRALIFMANQPMGTAFMRSDLAKQCCVPDSFLGKILQSLAKSEILTSERGKKGGFRLGMPPEKIRVYDIVVAVDGPLNINNCLDDKDSCCFEHECRAHVMWADIQNTFIEKLKTYTLADIAKKP